MTTQRNVTPRFLFGCLGWLLIVFALATVGADISRWTNSGEWRTDSLLDGLRSPTLDPVVPEDFAAWLQHPRSLKILHAPTIFLLDAVPQWIACLVVGAFIAWRGLG